MHRLVARYGFIALLLVTTLVASENTLDNDGLIALHEASLSDELLIATIGRSVCDFDLSVSGLKQLSKAGFGNGVLEAVLSYKGQSPTRSKGPESGLYYLRDGTQEPLVRARPLQGSRSRGSLKALVGGSMKQGVDLRSARASVRLEDSSPAFFLAGGGDPYALSLVKLQVRAKKGLRTLVVAQAGIRGVRSGEQMKDRVRLVVEEVEDGLVKILPESPLAPGEYCLYAFAGTDFEMIGASPYAIFDFGLD